MATRRCSECGESLAGLAVTAKTCSQECRQKRSRRLRRQKVDAAKAAAATPEQRELSQRARNEVTDAVRDVAREELRPVVREAITQEVLDAVASLVGLTPTAVEKIKEDLESDDTTIRQRAYTLVTKYTIGHPAIMRPPEEEAARTLTVNFDLPRPEVESAVGTEDTVPDSVELVADATEVKPCDNCGEDKPLDQFVAGSDRCQTCFDAQHEIAKAMLNKNPDAD